MSVERIIHCDFSGCGSHQSTTRPAPSVPPGWVRAVEGVDPEPVEFHFCGWDCAMKYAATITPPEIIEVAA